MQPSEVRIFTYELCVCLCVCGYLDFKMHQHTFVAAKNRCIVLLVMLFCRNRGVCVCVVGGKGARMLELCAGTLRH